MFDSLKKKLKEFTGKASEVELDEAPAPPPAKALPAPAKAPAEFEVVKKPAPSGPQAKPPAPTTKAPPPAAPAAKPLPPAKKSDEELESDLDAELEAEIAALEAEQEKPTPAPAKVPEPKPVAKIVEPKSAPAPARPVEPKAGPAPARPVEPKAGPAPARPVEPKAAPVPAKPVESKPAPLAAKSVESKPAPQPAKAPETKPVVPEAPKPPAPKPPAPERRSIDDRVAAALQRSGAAAAEPIAPVAPPKAPARVPVTVSEVERAEAPASAHVPAAVAPTPAAPAPKAPPAPEGGSKTINIEKIEELLWDLEVSLLESDVAMTVVEEIKVNLTRHLASVRVRSQEEVAGAVERALRQAILDALSMERIDFDSWVVARLAKKRPIVVMFVGVNGTGKTTAIGRIGHRLKEHGFTSVMAAGDTFRAGAIQQLEKHGERLGIAVVKHQSGGDPAAVAYDAIEHAKARMKDVVLLDTAGRMQTNTNLMDEMKKIKRIAEPDLIVFVGDSLAGNDAVEQAQKFNAAVGLDAVILTKVDTDAKGGAALSIAHAVGKPILFLGVGQDYGDLVAYDPEWMVNRIFES